ncbi:MAG: IclR family transcriptional regulator, acetate operon repressor [Thermoleophilaceae bacterium]|jgi:DNA-binding IclR family transcriptional regulator|nr:IclR family transcriptional regulator, acetate operon repressor [Thermoleophilaceae bacterium]MEA2403273.1 IclR family transcriptional regulator, acetate operon repressor [Thermoleophilaceae bacterium]
MEQEFQPVAGTQVIDRGAQLLALVLESEAPRGLTDLAADANLPKSTASRLLGALERHGLVEQQGMRGRFRAGPVMLRFASRGAAGRNLAELAERPMAALAEATGETINLAVAGPTGVEHLAQVESRHYLGTTQWVGRRVPYHASANGKVLLAAGAARMPDGDTLEPLTSRTIVEPALLASELEQVRRDGFATANDELELGLSAIAAPVLDEAGRVVAALSVSGPTLRLTARRVAELRPIVIKQARALSKELGHRPEGVHAA